MNIRDRWVMGCLVDCFDWVDGKNIYLNIRRWKDGGSIHQKPIWEKTVLIPKEEEQKVRYNLDSIVMHFLFN